MLERRRRRRRNRYRGAALRDGGLERRLPDRRHSADLDPHRARKLPAERVHVVAEAHEQRAAERLALDDLELVARRDPALRQISEHLGLGVRHAREDSARTRLERLEACGHGLFDFELAGRDRVTVGIVGRIAELARDQLLEFLGQDVFEHLGLLVHAIPGHPEALDQIELEQPVVADYLERDAAARVGQLDAVVGLVDHEPELAEALDHSRGRRGGDAQPVGERVGADGPVAALLQRVDRLRVVLDRRRAERIRFLSDRHERLWYA